MLTGSVDPKKFLIDLRYHLLSTWTTAVCMHLLGYIMVILFRPEGNKFIAGDSNQLFYLLGISGITSMILSLVSVKKNLWNYYKKEVICECASLTVRWSNMVPYRRDRSSINKRSNRFLL